MTVARYIQHAWNRGEVDPLAEARSDVGWYVRSCARARNVITLPLGPARRRSGLRHVSSARGAGRVLPFVFAADERYLFVLADVRLDVYRHGDGALLDTVVTPWTEAQLGALNYTQFADTMLVFHGQVPVQQIVRHAEDDWRISEVTFTHDGTLNDFGASNAPATGKFHKNRLVLAGLPTKPTTIWMSSARDVFEFNEGNAADDDAVVLKLLGDTLDDIRQVQSLHNNLLFFTASGEWAIVADVITPKTPGATPYTGFGAANVAPLVVEEAVLFLSAPETGRHALLEATWDAVSEGFLAQDVSLIAGHLLEDCTRIAYRQGDGRSAANHVYVVNGDGSVAVLNTLRRQDVTGWSLLTTDGAIRDIAVLGATAYALVERAGEWSIEAFDASHYLDASVRQTADPPTTAWSGLDHLEGRTVQVRGDGLRLADATVSGGAIATEFAVAELEAGLGYSWELLTLPPPAAQIQRATLQEGWRISHVLVDLYESAAVQVDGQPLTPRMFAADAWDGPVPIVTGQHMAARLGYQDPARVRIHGDDPMPATIRAATFWVS